MEPLVILVDEMDREIGSMNKMEAHVKGLLHRAFSVFIFNSQGEYLLQQRAADKYHSPLLWSNACCSHPMPGEEISHAANRRLMEELGFQIQLEKAFAFIYQTTFSNGLSEHEYDYVFVGRYDGPIFPAAQEVADTCFISPGLLQEKLQTQPDQFTEWFKIAYPKLVDYLAGAKHSALQ